MPDATEHLFSILSQADFLSMKGLANEVPIFIYTYEPHEEDALQRVVNNLASRLRAKGITLAVVDLFDLFLDQLEEEKRLDRIVEMEAYMGKQKLLELLGNLADPQSRLIPRLMQRMGGDDIRLTLLTGVGRVFPFLRTHTILESLQPAMMPHPVVMFFPGHYTQENGIGSQLRLFGSIPSPPLYRPYYRAFNLAHYRLS
ncbi:MAG: hypothetical protein A3F84_09090 [Candidatus Handelsmanbacteria bacterium RIFCSPLOWO2_12_FULL_64_10]|uniref:DUF1788 domain-containing protein n=1 Tax=Handelsmanbacteria sp. (strain RIFCSPLOWO2_12_FULL_64_10) TaxID=1817868 RepID=A0A1F6CTB9_HANXR|nr:MAG: hypothetical protein A3F84_09090 [Candidatus Handelsmanbacteria bacterium RIFCSPLOWO2_12_FULL_64_10]